MKAFLKEALMGAFVLSGIFGFGFGLHIIYDLFEPIYGKTGSFIALLSVILPFVFGVTFGIMHAEEKTRRAIKSRHKK